MTDVRHRARRSEGRGLALAIAISAATALAPPLFAGTDPLHVDLNASLLYVRAGFDRASTLSLPVPGASGWKVLPPAGREGRNARPIDLGLEGLPARPPFSLQRYPVMEFTYLIPFELGAEAAALMGARPARAGDGSEQAPRAVASIVPGLHFAGLGDNWEIFLNGLPVRAELHIGASGEIRGHRANRDIRFPVEGSVFREGENLLAIRFVADPTFPPAGFHQADPYYVGSYEAIEKANNELWPVALCGLYLFIGIYHIFIFLVRRKERHNLFYGLFSVDLALYLFARTHSANLFLMDSLVLFKLELSALFILLPFVGLFLETLNDDRVKRVSLFYGLFCVLLTFGEIAAPPAFAHDLLRVWQVSGLIMCLYYFGYEILWRFLSDGRRRWARLGGAARKPSLAAAYLSSLGTTPIGNLLLGGLILVSTAIFDIVDAVFLQWDLVLTQYGFFVFTMGTALVLANRLGFLHERLGGLNLDLEERLRTLTETGARLAASERRYRSLFEGSSDPVALLGEDLGFIEGNRAAAELFGLDRPGSAPAALTEALYAEKRGGTIAADLLREAARELKGRDAPRELAVTLKTPLGDPKAARLRLERIEGPDRAEILLRALPESKDGLAEAYVEGRERYSIESGFAAADEVCRRASERLRRYLPEEDSGFLAVCLREVVLNAIEHGSLEISFEEKSASQRSGKFFELVRQRRLDQRYRSRRVVVEYSISPERATYRVSDEGPGFDHRALMGGEGVPDVEMLEHGRGLFMARSAFDRVAFNDKGNQITLVKYLKNPLS